MPSIIMSKELQRLFIETLERVELAKSTSAGDSSIIRRIVIGLRRAKYKPKKKS